MEQVNSGLIVLGLVVLGLNERLIESGLVGFEGCLRAGRV